MRVANLRLPFLPLANLAHLLQEQEFTRSDPLTLPVRSGLPLP
jgi:hypothetical protein